MKRVSIHPIRPSIHRFVRPSTKHHDANLHLKKKQKNEKQPLVNLKYLGGWQIRGRALGKYWHAGCIEHTSLGFDRE